MAHTLTESGLLPNGVLYEGSVHREFELREQIVQDSVEILEDKALAGRAEKSDTFFNLCVYAKRIVRLGDIPREAVTPELLLGMLQEDFHEITQAARRLEERRRRFREQGQAGPQDGDRASQTGV